MRFLIDANMPRFTAELLKRSNHASVDLRDIGMGGAADSDIAAYAQQNRLVLVTRDFDFANIRNYPPAQYAGLLVLELPDDATATFVRRVIESFISQKDSFSFVSKRPRRRKFPPVTCITAATVSASKAALLGLGRARPAGLQWRANNSRTCSGLSVRNS